MSDDRAEGKRRRQRLGRLIGGPLIHRHRYDELPDALKVIFECTLFSPREVQRVLDRVDVRREIRSGRLRARRAYNGAQYQVVAADLLRYIDARYAELGYPHPDPPARGSLPDPAARTETPPAGHLPRAVGTPPGVRVRPRHRLVSSAAARRRSG